MTDLIATLDRLWTRYWRRWVVQRFGRFRARTARCRVCGKVFEWSAPVKPAKCPECTWRYRGQRLGNAKQDRRTK